MSSFISDLLDLLGIEKRHNELVPSSLSQEQKQAIVDKHNLYRSEEQASNMKYMVCTGLRRIPLSDIRDGAFTQALSLKILLVVPCSDRLRKSIEEAPGGAPGRTTIVKPNQKLLILLQNVRNV